MNEETFITELNNHINRLQDNYFEIASFCIKYGKDAIGQSKESLLLSHRINILKEIGNLKVFIEQNLIGVEK